MPIITVSRVAEAVSSHLYPQVPIYNIIIIIIMAHTMDQRSQNERVDDDCRVSLAGLACSCRDRNTAVTVSSFVRNSRFTVSCICARDALVRTYEQYDYI